MQSITNNNIITSTVGYKTGTHGYSYDGNGNMAIDSAKQISISYNMLDLPQSLFTTIIGIQDPSRGHGHGGGGPVIVPLAPETYSYDADGNKLAFAYQSTATGHPQIYTYYIDGIQYDTDPNTGGLNLSFIQTEEGRVLPYSTDTANYYQYYLTDHLGNTRVAFDSPTGQGLTVEQLDDYLPFGLDVESIANYPANEYLYNKKELQQFTGVYDYGARFYDPVIARWTTIDQHAEKYLLWSTYAYGLDNPIENMDVDGRDVLPSKYFSTTQFGKTFQNLRSNNKAFQREISKFENNKQYNLRLSVDDKKVLAAGAGAITRHPDPESTNDTHTYFMSTTTVPTYSDYEYSEIGKVLVVGHEAVHEKISLTEVKEDDDHNEYNKSREDLVDILKEYSTSNNLNLSDADITALSFSGQESSKDFQKYIGDLAKTDKISIKKEKGKYDTKISNLIYKKKKDEKK